MSYGQNKPWGLQATKSLGASTWNGQTSPYLIDPSPNATVNSIFRGDPVVMRNTGYITSLYDVGNEGAQLVAPILGVFDGCSYIQPTSQNPIDPASPGRSFWPAGTTVVGNVPVAAYVIDDPNTIFNVQATSTNGSFLIQGNIGNTAAVAFTVTDNKVAGDTNTGVSLAALDLAQIDVTNTWNLKIMRFVPYTNGTVTNGPGIVYANVEVLIQNHFYCSRPAGI